MDSPLTINISMNGKAMRHIRKTVSCFPFPKLEIKRKHLLYVYKMLWVKHLVQYKRFKMGFKSLKHGSYKDPLSLHDASTVIMEQIIFTINYVTVQGKYLFLPCLVLKILLETLMKLHL